MSNAGQAALTIVGGVIGFVATGGNPSGAMWGYRLDGMPGCAAFATTAADDSAAGPGSRRDLTQASTRRRAPVTT